MPHVENLKELVEGRWILSHFIDEEPEGHQKEEHYQEHMAEKELELETESSSSNDTLLLY